MTSEMFTVGRADRVWATDLLGEQTDALARGEMTETFSATLWTEAGLPYVGTIEMLYVPNHQRIGIVWGADAVWGNCMSNSEADLCAALNGWYNDELWGQ